MQTPDSPEDRIPEPQTPTEPNSENTPQQVTILLTIAMPLQVGGKAFDPNELPRHAVIASEDYGAMLWAMLTSMKKQGGIADSGALHVWSSREVS